MSADDLEGLRLMRDRAPAGMNIAAGEYGYDLWYFRRMLEAERWTCYTPTHRDAPGYRVSTGRPADRIAQHEFSAHCAPSMHVGRVLRNAESTCHRVLHDHARIEHMLFDGALTPVRGTLTPDRSRPGLGLEFKRDDAARFAI